MRQFITRLLYCCITGVFCLCLPISSAQADTDTVWIESVKLYPSLWGDTLEIRTNKPLLFVSYTLESPQRLVIDPVDTDIRLSFSEKLAFKGTLIQQMDAVSPAGETQAGSQIDYMTFPLLQDAEHLVEQDSTRLLVRVRPVKSSVDVFLADMQRATGYALRPGPTNEVPRSNVLLPATAGGPAARPWSLQQALEFGLSRHRPVKIAQKEIELAQLKIREAKRALYPAATLKFSWTNGTASNVDFREFTSGIQMEHPLYYSGQLMETYRQSLVNLQVSEKRHTKVRSDFSLDIAEAYFQLIGAKSSLDAQQNLEQEAANFLKDVKKRFSKKLLTKLEVLNVESQVNQARFQKATADNDVILAQIKFLQKLNLTPDAVVDVPSSFQKEGGMIDVDLEEAVRLSAAYRPDIQVNSLLVEFHEYEERIEKAKGKLKVDLSGFVGASAAAFETESLDVGDDYFVGIKASKPWGANSVEANVTTTKTSPRLGQTTRTDSTVYSLEMGLLDKLQGASDMKQAQINLEKARRDLDETKANVFQEVQEAYISYSKAKLQLAYAKQKIDFRKEQVKILKAQSKLNEVLPSQVLEAIMKLTEEKVGEAQALSNYYTALAKLNKAVGLPGKYK